MFDGERCLRCKNHFKFEELTVGPGCFSLCRDCAPKLDPKEPARACPVDGGVMKKELVQNLVTPDRCEACGGVWFDRNEVETMREIVKHRSDEVAASAYAWLMFMTVAAAG